MVIHLGAKIYDVKSCYLGVISAIVDPKVKEEVKSFKRPNINFLKKNKL